jgi:RNA polymerase sporulation-specific sigma factor
MRTRKQLKGKKGSARRGASAKAKKASKRTDDSVIWRPGQDEESVCKSGNKVFKAGASGYDFHGVVPDSVYIEASSSSEDEFDDLETPHDETEAIGTVFDVKGVDDPLIGTPKEVQDELDEIALKLQKRCKSRAKNDAAFMKIVSYMHKYILGLVFKKYSFVAGCDEKDMYNQALIALHQKAIPKFDPNRDMSFLNFAKMCINKHLITILHASRNRRKDLPLNTAISLDHNPASYDEDEDTCPLSNVVTGGKSSSAPFDDMVRNETFDSTLGAIKSKLSGFERAVLVEYLEKKSYREAAKSVARKYGEKCNEKSIDNALLRIRKKATDLRDDDDDDSLPLIQ